MDEVYESRGCTNCKDNHPCFDFTIIVKQGWLMTDLEKEQDCNLYVILSINKACIESDLEHDPTKTLEWNFHSVFPHVKIDKFKELNMTIEMKNVSNGITES